tara:strand:+ start:1195 stop:1410 length:216 start_codon:yes stop_codon:yes gene_type:complete
MEGTVEISVVLKMIEEAYDRGYERGVQREPKRFGDGRAASVDGISVRSPAFKRDADLFRVISKFTSTQGYA